MLSVALLNGLVHDNMLRIVEHNFSVGVIVLFFEVLDVVSFQHAILIVPLLNLILFKERIYPLTPSQERA